jgi:hypothetical protein
MKSTIGLSTIIGIMTLIQLISTISIGAGWHKSELFTLEHEDTVFILLLCTWFIVKAIENLKEDWGNNANR